MINKSQVPQMMGLYETKDYKASAADMLGKAGTSAQNMMRKTPDPNQKTAGGAIATGMAGAGSGAMIGAQIGSVGGPVGAVAGAAVGLLSYLLS